MVESEEDDTELGLSRQTTAPTLAQTSGRRHKRQNHWCSAAMHVALEEKDFKRSSFCLLSRAQVGRGGVFQVQLLNANHFKTN